MKRALVFLSMCVSSSALAGRGTTAVLPQLPDRFEVAAASEGDGPMDGPWWESFGDAGLDALMRAGLDGNFDLRAASDRIRQADAVSLQRLGPLLPNLSFGYRMSGAPGEVIRGRQLSFLEEGALPGFAYTASGSLSADLALDVTGRGVLGYQAARKEKQASGYDRAELAMAIAQRIAAAWFDVAMYRQQLTLLEQQVATNQRVLEITELTFGRGEGTAVQVLQQRQQIAATEARIPLLRAAQRVSEQQLAILTGQAPGTLEVSWPEALPALPAAPSLGAPADLMDNRPDLLAADQRLTAAWQQRMASERAFLPSLGIGATLDGSYSNYQNIEIFPQPGVEFGSFYGWGINASVSLPIFDGGVTIGRLRQARATESAAAHQLGGATLLAMAEVEGAATQEAEQTARYEAVLSQASAAKAAMDAALSRYKDGVLDYLTLLSTLRAQQEAELAAVQAQRDLLSARMSLYDALGGAWTESFARTSSGGR